MHTEGVIYALIYFQMSATAEARARARIWEFHQVSTVGSRNTKQSFVFSVSALLGLHWQEAGIRS